MKRLLLPLFVLAFFAGIALVGLHQASGRWLATTPRFAALVSLLLLLAVVGGSTGSGKSSSMVGPRLRLNILTAISLWT